MFTTKLDGAFKSGSGLPESKAEKRVKLEIAELKAMDTPPKWTSSALLEGLRAKAKADKIEPTPPAKLQQFSLRDAIVKAAQIFRIDHDDAPDGKAWWAVLCKEEKDDAAKGGRRVICLGQDKACCVRAAAARWPAADFKKNPPAPLYAADATDLILIDDGDVDVSPSIALGHPTVVGYGEENQAPGPASRDMHGAAILHLAEGARLCLLAKSQVNARLQRGGCSAEEKALVKLLLREVNHRLLLCAEEEFDVSSLEKSEEMKEPIGLNRCESAAAGLRKMYLKRPFDERCTTCGTRHHVVESGTCKFWVRWIAEAKEREEEEVKAKEVTDPEAAAAAKERRKAEEAKVWEEEANAALKAVEEAERAAEGAVKVAETLKAAEAAAKLEEPALIPFMPKLREREAAISLVSSGSDDPDSAAALAASLAQHSVVEVE